MGVDIGLRNRGAGRRLVPSHDAGASLVEYAAVLALVAVLAVAALTALGPLAVSALRTHSACVSEMPSGIGCGEPAP